MQIIDLVDLQLPTPSSTLALAALFISDQVIPLVYTPPDNEQ